MIPWGGSRAFCNYARSFKFKILNWMSYAVDSSLVGRFPALESLITLPVCGSNLVIMPGHYLPPTFRAEVNYGRASWLARRLNFQS